MLDMAKELRNVLAYEADDVNQIPHMLNGVADGKVLVVAQTQQNTREAFPNDEVLRVFYGYYPKDEAVAIGRALKQKRSVTSVQIITDLFTF